MVDMVRNARREAILDLCRESEPMAVSRIVDQLIATIELITRSEPDYFSVPELAARLHLSRKSVERLGLPRHKFGSAIRYAREDVLAYEKSTREEAI